MPARACARWAPDPFMLDVFFNPRLQPLRLGSGLVLFAFALTHFLNHAVGLISVDAMNSVQDWRLLVTHSTVGSWTLMLAALTHIVLGLGKFAARRTLAMPAWEALQIGSGILVPILLIPHIVGVTYLGATTNFFYSYTSVAYLMWPDRALWQSLLLLVVWTHGCIGLNYWLRPRPWFKAWKLLLFAVAVAVPLLALTGFLAAARELHGRFADPAVLAQARVELGWPEITARASFFRVRDLGWSVYGGILAAVLAAYSIRYLRYQWMPKLAVTYVGGEMVRSHVGPTLLEISRIFRVPHTSVCGGRARCSTCRVRINQSAGQLAPPNMGELSTLMRIGAPGDVRLACQLRPVSDLTVTRLVTPGSAPASKRTALSPEADGVERQVAILFLDVRGFTRMSENRLPFDIVFLLNQFFGTVGAAIQREGGWIDKYMGDGMMAVFGRETGVETGCRQSIAAARAIDTALETLNQRLATEIPEGIRIGIGIHAGPVVIGRIGHDDNAPLTVIGRTVNEASRLEALTKEKGCQLVLSTAVAKAAGLSLTAFPSEHVEVRGSSSGLEVLLVPAARLLPGGTQVPAAASLTATLKSS